MNDINVDAPAVEATILNVGGVPIHPGTRRDIRLQVSESYVGEHVTVPLTVLNGFQPGPRLFVTAAVHGDELNGIAVAKELLQRITVEDLAGSLIVVPVANVLGLPLRSRYLPDRRDLNRSFPGLSQGSMASRLADTLFVNVVEGSDAGIDLHTASAGRTNLPQVRAVLDDEPTSRLAHSFEAPLTIDAPQRKGSLRWAAAEVGIPVITYEAGEALRFEPDAVGVGTAGVIRSMVAMGMLEDPENDTPAEQPTTTADETHWERAERGGIIQLDVALGEWVEEGQTLWTVSSPFGQEREPKAATWAGIVIGLSTVPLVNPGDAIVHIAVPDGEGEFDETVDIQPFL